MRGIWSLTCANGLSVVSCSCRLMKPEVPEKSQRTPTADGCSFGSTRRRAARRGRGCAQEVGLVPPRQWGLTSTRGESTSAGLPGCAGSASPCRVRFPHHLCRVVSRVGQVTESAGDSAEELHNVVGGGVLLGAGAGAGAEGGALGHGRLLEKGVLGVLRPLWRRGLTCRAETRHPPPEPGRELWHQVTQRWPIDHASCFLRHEKCSGSPSGPERLAG